MLANDRKPYVIVVDSGALSPHVSGAEIKLDKELHDNELLHICVDVWPGKDYRKELQPDMPTIKQFAREGRFPGAIVGCPFVTNALIAELKDAGIPVPPVFIVPSLHTSEYNQVASLRPLMQQAEEEGHIIDPDIGPHQPGSLAERLANMVRECKAPQEVGPSSHGRSIAPAANKGGIASVVPVEERAPPKVQR